VEIERAVVNKASGDGRITKLRQYGIWDRISVDL